MGIRPNWTGMFPGWSPTKIVQMVLIGCISRSRGQKKFFLNATLKNLFVWNYKAKSFHIWYIASSRGPLPKSFKLCSWGENWPRPGGHNFTLNYMRKTANDFFSWTAYRNLTKLNRNGPWVVPYRNCSNGSDWLHKKVTGQKIGFQNAIFKNLLVWNYKVQDFHIWYIALSRGPLPKLFKFTPPPRGQNWPRPGVTILHLKI